MAADNKTKRLKLYAGIYTVFQGRFSMDFELSKIKQVSTGLTL